MTQDRLAQLLGVDRRTVIRLEQGEVAPTLEVVEAVAGALGVPAFAFMYTALPPADPDMSAEYVEVLERWIAQDASARFGASLDCPQVGELIGEAVALTEGDLSTLIDVARAIRGAQFAPPETAELRPLDAVFS